MATRSPSSSTQLNTVDALAQLSFLIQGTLERRAAEREMSLIQTRLLGVLRDRTPTMNELARLLALDKSSITGLVDRAERRGYVRRIPSTADRRAVEVGLTDAGRSLAAEVEASFGGDVEAIVAQLPAADRATLSELISRLLIAHATSLGLDLLA
jgi:MarR family transcriptional regulator, lower aerobic nicotinate degradation pathway regulator